MKSNHRKMYMMWITIALLITSCKHLFVNTSVTATQMVYSMTPAGSLLSTPSSFPASVITMTPAQQSTLPSVSTLTSFEREEFVIKNISVTTDCKLPCWWGVTPEKTTWAETEELLRFLGVRIGASQGYDPNTIFHGTGGFDFLSNSIFNRIGFEEKNEMLYSIHITSEGYNDLLEFQRLWKFFSPSKIIENYGMPDRALLNVIDAYSDLGGYYLWFFYDKLGFSIRYPGDFKVEPSIQICPSIENTGKIDIDLQSPNNDLPLDRFDPLLEEKRLGTELGKLRIIYSLQEATGLNDKEIYDVFLQENPPCFTTPQEIWRIN